MRRKKIGLDDPSDPEDKAQCRAFLTGIMGLGSLQRPDARSQNDIRHEGELHAFCDTTPWIEGYNLWTVRSDRSYDIRMLLLKA